jgi:hypothetical protein
MTAGDVFLMLTDNLKANAEFLDELNEEVVEPVTESIVKMSARIKCWLTT